MSETVTRDVVGRRVLDAPPQEAWRAWSEPAVVARWVGPLGLITTPVADLDFREGGTSLLCMRAPAEYGGADYWNTWSYRSIAPHARIEFDLAFVTADRSPATPPGVPERVPHVVTLVPAGDGRTEVTVAEHGYLTDEARDLSQAGLEQCLDKMAAMYPAR